jgi:mRNA turnover protein 4
MPKSRRNKVVNLTATAKKGRSLKQGVMKEIRESVDKHERLFVFTYANMRSRLMKDVRMDFREDSRFFMGKNKIMQLALGATSETEYMDNLRRVSRHLKGQCGLLLTNRSKEEVQEYFANRQTPDFANSGFVAQQTITLPEGPTDWPVSMMDQLRKLGLMAEVQDSQLWLRKAFDMCREGQAITPEQAKLLVSHSLMPC